MAIAGVDTIVFLMMENRSFDHMLGHLSLGPSPMGVEGLKDDPAWRYSFANKVGGQPYRLHELKAADAIPRDPPHGWKRIEKQIDTPPAGPGPQKMGGFAYAYDEAHGSDPSIVMGYYGPGELPMYDFFASNFCVCDHWFASLPAGTQPNRLMAMAGHSRIAENRTPLKKQPLVYNWLNERGGDWRCYHWGDLLPFFTMMVDPWLPIIAESVATGAGSFRRYDQFKADWMASGTPPSVVFLEPQLLDLPFIRKPNDDHPKAPVSRGQAFMRRVYSDLISNPARWQRTLLIVTYDEHGGFFDHVEPLGIAGYTDEKTFTRTGVRVPAFLISPLVEKGQPFTDPLDHTSFLTLLAEHLGDPGGYSSEVSTRQAHLGKISDALRSGPRPNPAPTPPPLPPTWAAEALGQPDAPDTANAAAMDEALRKLAAERPELLEAPNLAGVKRYLETKSPPIPRNVDHVD